MNKHLFMPLLAVIAFAAPFMLARNANKQPKNEALAEVESFIKQTLNARHATIEAAELTRLLNRSKDRLISQVDNRGLIPVKEVELVKNQFQQYVNTTFPVKTAFIGYYDAVKKLQAHIAAEQEKILGKTLYGTRQALWKKLKREVIDKNLRKQAFIKNELLVVEQATLNALQQKLSQRVEEISRTQRKKTDRMISVGYAESRVRDILRRSGYRDPREVQTLLDQVGKEVKKIATTGRIALSKLEDITLQAIRRFKRTGEFYGKGRISRLGAEVRMLKAIKEAKLPYTLEIEASTKMMDALGKKMTKGRPFEEEVDAIIRDVLEKIKQKRAAKKPNKKVKRASKNPKRGTEYGRGRWGQLKHPRAATKAD